MLSVGSLFSGIGGFDLGLERAGMRCLWQCEIDPFCQRVLEKHWPDVLRVRDVRELRAGDVPTIDVLCGGFPCQDISLAGRGGGIELGSRSGLWREFARLIGELRPRYVIVENVPALTSRGLDIVLSDLAACGFDAEWDHLPASAFGAPHRRDRLWLVAYPSGGRGERRGSGSGEARSGGPLGLSARSGQEPDALADAPWDLPAGSAATGTERQRARESGQRSGAHVADSNGGGCEVSSQRDGRPHGPEQQAPRGHDADGCRGADADSDSQVGLAVTRGQRGGGQPESGLGGVVDGLSAWLDEPDIPRVVPGSQAPYRNDRLRGLGNALVPQIAEWIGERIMSFEGVLYREGAGR